MKSRVTGQPADICKIKRNSCNVSFLSNDIYLPPKDSHRNAPCPCGSGKKYKRCCEEKDKRLGKVLY